MELKETVLDLGRMRWEATKDENGEILYLSKTFLDGQLLTDNELYGKDTLIKYPEGIITKKWC